MNKVELLAPAGTKEAFYAALYSGANAIYIGGKFFGARAFAENFTNEEIETMIQDAHFYDASVYVTINTIVRDDEWEELDCYIAFLQQADCDAVIIQDLGVMDYILHCYPDLNVHASTQMNVHSVDEVRVLQKLGVKRVVLARELSLDQIRTIKEQVDIEVEVFVHGALCINYSGHCYMSSLIGKRSGNRGRCAQPCRLAYQMGDQTAYWLSPKDLYTLDRLTDLIDAGIDSFKIEGRMKSSTYVHEVVSAYKMAIDAIQKGKNIDEPALRYELEKIFHRGFTKGYLFEESHQDFTQIFAPNHQGVFVGKVISHQEKWIIVEIKAQITQGDGLRIVFDGGEDGIIVNQMFKGAEAVFEANPGDQIRLLAHQLIPREAVVYLTSSARQQAKTQKKVKTPPKIPIFGKLFIEDKRLKLEISDGTHNVVVQSSVVEFASNPSVKDRIIAQITKTQSSLFEFDRLEVNVEQAIFLPIKEINGLRRSAFELLETKRKKRYDRRRVLSYPKKENTIEHTKTKLCVRIRTMEQFLALDQTTVSEIFVQGLSLYQSIIATKPNGVVSYAEPRIHLQEEFNSGWTSSFACVQDKTTSMYLPCANHYTLMWLHEYGAKTVGLSIEASVEQIHSMLQAYEQATHAKANVMVMVYGYYEAMIMKHDVLQKKEKSGEIDHLMDRKGARYPILYDENHQTILLFHQPLHLLEAVGLLQEIGVSKLLLDFTVEDKDTVRKIISMYQKTLQGETDKDFGMHGTFAHFKEGVY